MPARLDVAVSLGLSIAEIAAQFAPVPYLEPAVGVLVGICSICAQLSYCKFSICQLRDRCHMMLRTLKDSDTLATSQSMDEILQETYMILFEVRAKVEEWSKMKAIKYFVDRRDVEKDILRCQADIDNCLAKFHLTAQLNTMAWQNDFAEYQRRDHEETMEYMTNAQHMQEILLQSQEENKLFQQELMAKMQELLGQFSNQSAPNDAGLQQNLYQLTQKSGKLLPNFNLAHGEVKRLNEYPQSSSTTGLDIWEGTYLNSEKVAIKVIRAVNYNDKTRRRFFREAEIWRQVWEIDRGRHILPFYGFCEGDGPYPYMVSPWQKHGTATRYVKVEPDVNHKRLVRHIGEGIKLLHTMSPKSIVHGDIRGANIQVNARGDPLLADFGVSKIVEDLEGVPFTRSNSVSDACRWAAPELMYGENMRATTHSDIYAFAMTILELMTHAHPFSYVRATPEVVIRVHSGQRPKRPVETPEILERGLNDAMWAVLQRCWHANPLQRPSIQEVLDELPEN